MISAIIVLITEIKLNKLIVMERLRHLQHLLSLRALEGDPSTWTRVDNLARTTKRTPLPVSLVLSPREMRSLLLPAHPAGVLDQSAAIFCSPESRATVRALITHKETTSRRVRLSFPREMQYPHVLRANY